MVWALSFFAAGITVIGLVSLRRRPPSWAALGFAVLLLIIFGVLSLGMTGAWLEQLFRPLIKAIGLYPDAQDSLWRISMMLSVVLPLGLLLVYAMSRRVGIWVGVLLYLAYSLVADILVHFLIRLI